MLDKRIANHEEEFVSQAIRLVKFYPCCICGGEGWCGVKYKGTCKIYRELKCRLIDVRED